MSPGTFESKMCQRRPWRRSGRTIVHQLSDDIYSALYEGFVHSYLHTVEYIIMPFVSCYCVPGMVQDSLLVLSHLILSEV